MSERDSQTTDRPYADPTHPGNKIRPRVRCIGCGAKGCTTAWGPWCFGCNVKRIDRISGNLERMCREAGVQNV